MAAFLTFCHGKQQLIIRTSWIRVMRPDGGGGRDGVETNRGFVFIPEVGDHVLVGFRHNDPNRPYVMGACSTESPAVAAARVTAVRASPRAAEVCWR